MEQIIELLELVSGRLSSVASSEVIKGEPIELGNVTIVPLTRISMGFGGGGGQGEGEPHKSKKHKHGRGKGMGGAGGGAAKIRPVGLAIFRESGVEIVSIPSKKGALDKIFDKVPELIDRVKDFKEKYDSDSKPAN